MMFILTFWVEGVPQPVQMRFVDRDRALAVLAEFRSAPAGTVDLLDDFEARASVPRSRTLVVFFTDLERDVAAQIDIQVIQQRANAQLQTKLQSDTVLGLHATRTGLIRPQ